MKSFFFRACRTFFCDAPLPLFEARAFLALRLSPSSTIRSPRSRRLYVVPCFTQPCYNIPFPVGEFPFLMESSLFCLHLRSAGPICPLPPPSNPPPMNPPPIVSTFPRQVRCSPTPLTTVFTPSTAVGIYVIFQFAKPWCGGWHPPPITPDCW